MHGGPIPHLQVHKTLADWLRDPAQSGMHAASIGDGHTRIGLHLAETWRQQSSGSLASSGSSYMLKYMVVHLAAAAQYRPGDAAGYLDCMLCDWSFLKAIIDTGNIPAVIGALGGMESHTVCYVGCQLRRPPCRVCQRASC